jgi:serine/threonine protein kinase
VGTAGGMHYLAWPLVEGKTLDKIVEEQGKLTTEMAAQYAFQTAEGLEICHQQNLFHGLLKPSNLMIAPDGTVRILDFGIGCLLAETEGESLVDTMSTANSVNSGLDCASPESILDPSALDAVGDQYSLGCVLYYCLAGRYPFPEGTAVEKMMCHQHKQPTPLKDINPSIPDEMVAIVERLMQKVPANRFANCSEVIEALRPFTQQSPQRRPTMAMPKVKLPKPAAKQPNPDLDQDQEAAPRSLPRPAAGTGPKAPEGPGDLRPRSAPPRPLPPRGNTPGNAASPASISPLRPQPALPSRGTLTNKAPSPAPAEESGDEDSYDQGHDQQQAPPPPQPRSMGVVVVILIALAAGVASYFISNLLPKPF